MYACGVHLRVQTFVLVGVVPTRRLAQNRHLAVCACPILVIGVPQFSEGGRPGTGQCGAGLGDGERRSIRPKILSVLRQQIPACGGIGPVTAHQLLLLRHIGGHIPAVAVLGQLPSPKRHVHPAAKSFLPIRNALVHGDFKTRSVGAGDDVDHPALRVRPVNTGSPIGQDLHPLNRRQRQGIEVNPTVVRPRTGLPSVIGQSAPVHQHQSASLQAMDSTAAESGSDSTQCCGREPVGHDRQCLQVIRN